MPSFAATTKALLPLLLVAAWLPATSQQSPSTTDPKNDPRYSQASELYKAGNLVDAMPLFEELAAAYPKDAWIHESWAFSMMGYAATVLQPEERKKIRVRARKIALQAQQLGDSSPLLQTILQIAEKSMQP